MLIYQQIQTEAEFAQMPWFENPKAVLPRHPLETLGCETIGTDEGVAIQASLGFVSGCGVQL